MNARLQISPLQWVGWVEHPCEVPGFAAGPVYLVEVQPLKTGKGLLRLDFLQPLRPGGGTRRSLTLKVVQHDAVHLTCLFEEAGAKRTAIISTADFEWMRTWCLEHFIRRPVQHPSTLIDGRRLPDTKPEEHFARVFGRTDEEILHGAMPSSFGAERPPMPSKTDSFLVDIEFGPFDSWLISRGFVPWEMEEKWFVTWENGRLLFRRSWTGILIYDVEAQRRGDRLYLGSARVNRDPAQYEETDADHDRALLLYLVQVVLLGQRANYPFKKGDEEVAAIQAWSVAGSASLG